MGITYLVISIFAGGWGSYMYRVRRKMIIERSGKDFDNMTGPIAVSAVLLIALVTNFFFQVTTPREVFWPRDPGLTRHTHTQYSAAIDRLAGSSPPTPAV